MSSSTLQPTLAYEPASVYLLWILGFGGNYYPGVFLHNSNKNGRLAYGCDSNEHNFAVRILIKESNKECGRIPHSELLPAPDSCRYQILPNTSSTTATEWRAFGAVGVSRTSVSLPTTTAGSVGPASGSKRSCTSSARMRTWFGTVVRHHRGSIPSPQDWNASYVAKSIKGRLLWKRQRGWIPP